MRSLHRKTPLMAALVSILFSVKFCSSCAGPGLDPAFETDSPPLAEGAVPYAGWSLGDLEPAARKALTANVVPAESAKKDQGLTFTGNPPRTTRLARVSVPTQTVAQSSVPAQAGGTVGFQGAVSPESRQVSGGTDNGGGSRYGQPATGGTTTYKPAIGIVAPSRVEGEEEAPQAPSGSELESPSYDE